MKKINALIEIAKKDIHRKPEEKITQERIELALAWVNNEVTLSGVGRALNLNNNSATSTYLFLARTLRTYIKNLPKK